MRNLRRPAKTAPMSADAYAGFLKLLLTPAGREPRESADVDAYLRYVGETAPLSDATRRFIGQGASRAA